MIRVLIAVAILSGVAFAAAVWWPRAGSPRTPPSAPPEETEEPVVRPPEKPRGPGEARPERPTSDTPAVGPGQAAAVLSEAQTLVDLGRPEQAIDRLDAVLAADPKNAEALYQRGKCHLALGMPRLAERDLRAAVADKETPERLEALSESVQMRLPDEAIGFLEKSAQLDPARSHPWAMIARIQYRMGRRKDASESVARALSINPSDETALALQDKLR